MRLISLQVSFALLLDRLYANTIRGCIIMELFESFIQFRTELKLANAERRCNTAHLFTNMIVRNALAQRDGLFSAVILFCYLPERRHSTTHLVCRPILFLLISTSQDLFTTGHALESSTIEEDYYYYSSYNYRLHSYCFVYVVTENTELRKLGITICMDFSQTRFPQYTFSPLGDSATKAVCS